MTMTAEDFIKTRKEGGQHPKFPKIETRICVCGAALFNHGRDEQGDLIFDGRCIGCLTRRMNSFTPEENEAFDKKMREEHSIFLNSRPCNQCFDKKPIPDGRWCAPCAVKINMEKLSVGGLSQDEEAGTVWALNYAMRYL